MTGKQWVSGDRLDIRHYETAKRVTVEMPEDTARKLALALGRLRQTYQVSSPEAIEELYQALNFVLVGDPASVAAHRRMEAGKGMEPAGADPRSYAIENLESGEDPCDGKQGY